MADTVLLQRLYCLSYLFRHSIISFCEAWAWNDIGNRMFLVLDTLTWYYVISLYLNYGYWLSYDYYCNIDCMQNIISCCFSSTKNVIELHFVGPFNRKIIEFRKWKKCNRNFYHLSSFFHEYRMLMCNETFPLKETSPYISWESKIPFSR